MKKMMLALAAACLTSIAQAKIKVDLALNHEEESRKGELIINNEEYVSLRFDDKNEFLIGFIPKEDGALTVTLMIRNSDASPDAQEPETYTVDTFWGQPATFHFNDANFDLVITAQLADDEAANVEEAAAQDIASEQEATEQAAEEVAVQA